MGKDKSEQSRLQLNSIIESQVRIVLAVQVAPFVDLEGETPAYLAGDTMRAFADVVCKLGCR